MYPMPGQQQQQRKPFRGNTRQRHQRILSRAYALNTALEPITIPQVGYLAAVIVQFRGTVTLSGAGALADLGPWNLVSKFVLESNQGAGTLFDLSGYGAFLVGAQLERGFRPDLAGSGGTTPSSDYFAAPVASGANAWALSWYLPVSLNNGKQFETGLINLQAPEVRLTLKIQTNGALTDVATLVTATTGNFFVSYLYYEVPPPEMVYQPPLMVARRLEEQQSITQVGDFIYQIPRAGTLLSLMQYTRLNGARSDSIDEFRLPLNYNDTVYVYDRQTLKLLNRMWHDTEFPTGVYEWDFWHSEEELSEGDTRDAFDTEAVTTMQFVTKISAGATLGSGNNFQNSIRTIMQSIGG
jgi:hypothetical protein